jgi:hypothetical protein
MADAEKLFQQLKGTKFGCGFKYPYRYQIIQKQANHPT